MRAEIKLCDYPGCGEDFEPRSSKSRFCARTHEMKCADCEQSFSAPSGTMGNKETCRKCSYARAKISREKTMLERYGVKNPMANSEFKENHKATVRKNYGVDFPTQSSRVRAKVKDTNIERYGVDNPMKCEAFSEKSSAKLKELYGKEGNPEGHNERMAKRIHTNRERYGVNHPMQNAEIISKAAQTLKKNYGVTSPLKSSELAEKARATLLKNYGVDNPMKSEELRRKAIRTLEDRYGEIHALRNDALKSKAKETLKDRFGDEYFFKTEYFKNKSRETNLERRGFPYASQDPLVKEKVALAFSANANGKGKGSSGRVSKINKRWASELERLFSSSISFEPSMGKGMSADLLIGSVYLDINPTVTHNSQRAFACLMSNCQERPCLRHKPTAPDRHYSRAQSALESGLDYVQVYDWDSGAEVIELLSSRLERPARVEDAAELFLRSVSPAEVKVFCAEGFSGAPERSFCYGLFDKRELLAVAVFSPAAEAATAHEWVTYKVKPSLALRGAAERFWLRFLEDAAPDAVLCHIDFNRETRRDVFLAKLPGWRELEATGPLKVFSRGFELLTEGFLDGEGGDSGGLPVYTAGFRIFHWSRR